MSGLLIPNAKQQFLDANGNPLAGGFVYYYIPSTTTFKNTYQNAALTILNTNPIVLDSAGECIAYGTDSYRQIVTDVNGNLIWDRTTVSGISNDASNVIYTPPFTNSVAETVTAKLSESVSVNDFGAVGNGSTDDTTAIQNALNSGVKEIVFVPGKTYLINGGLTCSTAAINIIATGSTIKLKNNASSLSMLTLTGANSTVNGGTWDGNKDNGNSTGDTYGSFNVRMAADYCTVKNITSINTWGMSIKGFGNFMSALNNNIKNTGIYGIYFDGSSSVSNYGNKAIGNIIDMSNGIISGGQNQGQGILFTAGSGQNQIDWELSDNNITGPQTSVSDQAICLAVRGKNGIVSNNLTRYGAMGFSEGGENTVIDGNRFLNVLGIQYGIEPSGGNTVVSNNIVTDAQYGVICSGNKTYNNLTITGNNLTSTINAIKLQIANGYTGQNTVISGNYLKGDNGVYTTGDIKNLTISGNTLVGPAADFSAGRGVFINTPISNAYVFITGNTFVNWQRPYSIYSAASTTFNYLFATNNNLSLAGAGLNASFWTAEGSAVIGNLVVSANNINPTDIGLQFNIIDQATNLNMQYGTGSPNGSANGGIGSIFINKLGGSGTTFYVKESGANTNTGWVGK
jgi:hypothetical protein